MKQLTPWRWGGLRGGSKRKESDQQPLELLRQEMETFQSNIDRLFSNFFTGSASRLMLEPWGGEDMLPAINEYEDKKAYHVSMELPGMDEKDVDVTLNEGVLTIRGEKKTDDEEKGKDFYRVERSYGSIYRTISVPVEVDESKVQACFKKGVLHIDLPKSEEAQKKIRHIDVKAA